jgi:CRP/FNR family transcriptional regulator, nitrogen fixation regulation protein
MLEQATSSGRNAHTAHAGRPAQSDATSPQGTVLRLERHRSVFRAGDNAERFFEVESGSVMVYRILDDGRRQLVEVVFPGGICGLASSEEYESDCETLMPTVLRSYRLSDLARSDALRARVIGRLQRQVSALHDHTVSLGRKTAEERVCSLILRLHAVEASARQERQAVDLPMTRTEIADYLGLTLETVCRTLTALARRKLLEIGSNKTEITVPNLERLRQAACWDAC